MNKEEISKLLNTFRILNRIEEAKLDIDAVASSLEGVKRELLTENLVLIIINEMMLDCEDIPGSILKTLKVDRNDVIVGGRRKDHTAELCGKGNVIYINGKDAIPMINIIFFENTNARIIMKDFDMHDLKVYQKSENSFHKIKVNHPIEYGEWCVVSYIS